MGGIVVDDESGREGGIGTEKDGDDDDAGRGGGGRMENGDDEDGAGGR